MAKMIDGETPEAPKKETPKQAGVLTQEEMKKLEAEARAQVEAEIKAAVEKQYLDAAKARIKKAEMFKNAKNAEGDNVEAVYIDLAPFCEDVRLDGTRYLHGRTYHVTGPVAAVLKEQMHRSWRHQSEIQGADENQLVGRQPRHVNVSGRASA